MQIAVTHNQVQSNNFWVSSLQVIISSFSRKRKVIKAGENNGCR